MKRPAIEWYQNDKNETVVMLATYALAVEDDLRQARDGLRLADDVVWVEREDGHGGGFWECLFCDGVNNKHNDDCVWATHPGVIAAKEDKP